MFILCSRNTSKKFTNKRVKLNICCWNVRTLLDLKSSGRPERRTALVTKELQRLNIDIAALSETRFSDEDQLTEETSGYTIFWKGKPAGTRRDGGVGFAIKTSLISQVEQPIGISDRIMMLRVPLSSGRYLSIISVYAPTLQASEEVLDSFYESLRQTIRSVPKEEKLILLGDFNARVGRESETWNALGPYGIGKMNSNGLRLLELCSMHNLAIANTFFRLKVKHKVSWIHPRSKQGHLIDYIITRKSDISDACNVRVLRSAECDTDHKMVRGTFKLRIRRKIRMEGVKVPKRINVAKLSETDLCQQFENHLMDKDLSTSWEDFKKQLYSAGADILGFVENNHRDWFDENDANVKELLDTKHSLHQALLNSQPHEKAEATNALRKHKSLLQSELRRMKNSWWNKISHDIQCAANRNDSRAMYSLIRQAFGPKSSSVAPMKSSDGKSTVKDPDGIRDRWKEHFTNLFFNPSVVDNEVIDNLLQEDILTHMDNPPSLDEVKDVIKQINTGKAPGLDGIPVELLRHGGDSVASAIHNFITLSWEGNPIPQDWIDGILVSLYKGKGLKSVCDSYRGITLLESVGKVLARLLLNRITDNICPTVVPESQCGFRSGRGTTDMIFSVRQLQEKCIEQQMPLYQVFVDLTKAFDTVNRDALWKILSKLGCPPNFVNMVSQLHRDMKARLTFNGSLSEEIGVENGVKQGDILAPTLFSIYFSVMLSHAFSDCDAGVSLRFRTSGKLFNLRRFHAKSKTFTALVRELLYADDAVLVAHTESDMQLIMDHFSAACDAFGLTISIKKTKVMFTPAPGAPYSEPTILVNGDKLEVVDTFPYLGSTISRDGSLDAEIYSRIQKACVAFGKLENRVWSDRGITNNTKINVYKACVLTSLLFSSETWTTHRRHIKLLERFHQKCLRRILNIKWQSMTPDTEVLVRAGTTSIESMVILNQLRWTGHVVRMNNDRLPKRLLYGEFANGKRPRRKPRKRYKDCISQNIKATGMDSGNWEEKTIDRVCWRSSVKEGCAFFEQTRTENEKIKRSLRKGTATDLPSDLVVWKCDVCDRILKSKAGYVNHVKSHDPSKRVNYNVLPPRPAENVCVLCGKVCKSASGLKRHMAVHKESIPQLDPINPVKCTSFICQLCHRPFKTLSGLKSHLRAHARNQTEN